MNYQRNETPEQLAGAAVESCISALVIALQQEKGWLHDYADSVVRDAIDRKHLEPLALPAHPEPHSHTWTDQEKRCILAWGAELVSTNTAALQAKDAEIARLKADARRLDWLEQWHDMPDGGDVGVNMIERTSDGWWSEIGDSEHDTLREAIDAAMKGEAA